MKIVADQAIADVASVFAPLGELVLLPGRDIGPDAVRDADALLVRTITRIDAALLGDSPVQFVGSAASGTDHVDLDFLASRSIAFASAPGCNADAVVNYVFAALAWLDQHRQIHWRDRSVGIVGAGNVGSRLAATLLALGSRVLVHDPFLPASHPLAGCFAALDDVLNCDIISLHVPLTLHGNHPTFHLLSHERLRKLQDEAILINAARGEVIDNIALLATLETRDDLAVVLDVWEKEPAIHAALLQRVAIGTPHIAGYSKLGKSNATRTVYEGLCRHFDLSMTGDTGHEPKLPLEAGSVSDAIRQAYPIQQDFLPVTDAGLAGEFERRRNGYRFRREFRDCCFSPSQWSADQILELTALGFVSSD